jgi:hypothetical protein
MGPNVWPEPDFPEVGTLLALSGLFLFFSVKVTQFAVINQATDWGVSIGGYLYQVKVMLSGYLKRPAN